MASSEFSPLLLAIDGDSLLHRAHHAYADSEELGPEGRPAWGLRGLLGFIAAAAARFTPDGLVVGFDSREHSVRKAAFPAYKAHRPDKPPPLAAQLEDAPLLLAAAGVPVVSVPGYEADDVLASAAALARRGGWRAVLVTSDRDSFALIDQTTSVLRLVNGGIEDSPLLTPAALPAVCGVGADQYRDYAALRGDSSDNLPGVPGFGGKTAARLLSAFRSLDDVYEAIDDGRGDEVSAVVGKSLTARIASPACRADVERNRGLMAMREDLALPGLTELGLPLDGHRLAAVLAGRDIRLGQSAWALVGGQRPPWTPPGFDRAPRHLPGGEPPPWAVDWGTPTDATPPQVAPAARPAAAARRPLGRLRPVPAGQLSLF